MQFHRQSLQAPHDLTQRVVKCFCGIRVSALVQEGDGLTTDLHHVVHLICTFCYEGDNARYDAQLCVAFIQVVLEFAHSAFEDR